MRVSVVFGLALFVLATTSGVRAAVPDPLQYFNGSWSCNTTMGNSTYSSTSNASQWGQWIRFNINTPAQNGMGASVGTGYLSWDNASNRWVYSEVDSDGTYFVSHSESPRIGRSAWVTGFPNMGGGTNIHINGRNSYVIDSTWMQNGRNRSSHMLCTRQ
jgi:hypothetical protein